jgi:hypothetical protein
MRFSLPAMLTAMTVAAVWVAGAACFYREFGSIGRSIMMGFLWVGVAVNLRDLCFHRRSK